MPIYKSIIAGFTGDSRDYLYQPLTTALPSYIDWRGGVKSIENQGSFGSCTANSVVAACELILNSNARFENLSRLFNYFESRKQTQLSGQDTGASLRHAVAEVKKLGLPLESLWPYTATNLNAIPPQTVYEDASTRLLDRYERINDGITYLYTEDPARNWILSAEGVSTIGDTTYIRDIKSALVEGYPVIIGFALNNAFEKLTGDFEYQKAHPWAGIGTSTITGYHAAVLIGYDDYSNAFILQNSWGSSWGYKGYALLPYNTLTGCVTDSWVLKGFMGHKILPSSAYNPEAKVVDPGFKDNVIKLEPTTPPTIAGTSISTLIQGSQLLESFTVIKWVQVLFVKGFTFEAKLKVSYLALTNKLRFWIEETSGDTLSVVNPESILEASIVSGGTPLDTRINAYTLPIYSKSGAVIILKVDITHADYLTFIQSTIAPNQRITKTSVETLSFLSFISAASNLNGSINRDVGLSLFDSAYLQVFNKRIIFPQNFTGIFHFLNSGFDKGMWVKQTKDSVSGDLYLSVANSVTGIDYDFGTPIIIAKNTGDLLNPVYQYPPNPYTSIPSLKYYFTSSAYGYNYSTTSPYPYFIAKSADGSTFVFTTVTALINKNEIPKEPLDFDMGSQYLGMYKSGTTSSTYGLGGEISNELILPDITILPTKNILGVRIISSGGISSSDIRLKQRTTSQAPYTTVQGDYPMLDFTNSVYLSFSEGNTLNDPTLYGDEVDVTESGTYILRSKQGGTITLVTNRLLINPYYNGSEKLIFNNTNQDIFSPVTAGQIISGSTEYFCVYLKNRHPTKTFHRIAIWSDLNCNNVFGDISNPQYLQLAMNDSVERDGAATSNLTIVDKNTVPIGLTFNFANAESEALIINDLAPQKCVPIWFKRVVNASNTIVKQDILNYLRMKVMY